MSAKRNRPIGAGAGRVGWATLDKLRTHYEAMWERKWPHDDDYLKVLWREAIEAHPADRQGYHEKRWDMAIMRMRENHEFEEDYLRRVAN